MDVRIDVTDARATGREETLAIIEKLALHLLESLAKGQDPTMHLV